MVCLQLYPAIPDPASGQEYLHLLAGRATVGPWPLPGTRQRWSLEDGGWWGGASVHLHGFGAFDTSIVVSR